MTPKILLADTSRWACTPRLAIGLRQAGVSVSAVFPAREHPLLKTRALSSAFPYSSLHPLESLAAAIEATRPEIIIPCDEWALQHLHELYSRAEALGSDGRETTELIERSLGRPESYPIVTARYPLLKIAQEEGILVPDMTSLSSIEDLESLLALQPFPWVMKADGTFGGRGVKIAHSIDEARRFRVKLTGTFKTSRVFKRVMVNHDPFGLRPWWRRTKPQLMVQSYIDGYPANCAVLCWQGTVLAGIGVEVIKSDGLTGPASVVRVVDSPEMKRAAERIALRLGLSGFFGLDFMIEQRSGRAYLIELNPRCTPLCHLQLGNGRDMIAALRGQLSGEPLGETVPITQSDIIAYFPQAPYCSGEFHEYGFHDVPREEPDLVQELLHPWPERSLPFRLCGYLYDASVKCGDAIDLVRGKCRSGHIALRRNGSEQIRNNPANGRTIGERETHPDCESRTNS